MAQIGFFDLADRYAGLEAKKDPLVEIDAPVPWKEFRPMLERVWGKLDAERKSRAGRTPIDAVPMFKRWCRAPSSTCPTTLSSISCATGCRPGRFLGRGLKDRVSDAKTV